MQIKVCPTCGDILSWMEDVLEWSEEEFRRRHHHHHHTAKMLAFTIAYKQIEVKGVRMTFTMLPTQSVSAVVSPVIADGVTASKATLSNVSFTSSDTTVLTVGPDISNPNGVLITGLGNTGSAIVTATATATEPDGTTTETIMGTVTVVLAVPPPAPAAALIFTFGVPTP